MDAKDFDSKNLDLLGNLKKEDIPEPQKLLKRELDSIDDFEHLEHDISPLKDVHKVIDSVGESEHTREILGKINKGVDSAENVASLLADQTNFDPLQKERLFDKPSTVAMDSNLLELVDTFPDRKEADAKLDKFLSEMSTISSPTDKQLKETIKEKVDDAKTASQNFMDMERSPVFHESPAFPAHTDIIERFTDSEPEDDFKLSKEDLTRVKDNDNVKTDMFKDFDDFELPKASAPILEPQKAQEIKKIVDNVKLPEITPEPKQLEPVIAKQPEPIKIPEPIKSELKPLIKEPVNVEAVKTVVTDPSTMKELDVKKNDKIPPKIESKPKTQAEAMFCKMGLDVQRRILDNV